MLPRWNGTIEITGLSVTVVVAAGRGGWRQASEVGERLRVAPPAVKQTTGLTFRPRVGCRYGTAPSGAGGARSNWSQPSTHRVRLRRHAATHQRSHLPVAAVVPATLGALMVHA